MLRAYKIVRVYKKKYLSMFITNEYALEYKIGEWTEPKIGYIFVFKKLKPASDFLRYAGRPKKGHFVIFEAEVKTLWGRFGNANISSCLTGYAIHEFWCMQDPKFCGSLKIRDYERVRQHMGVRPFNSYYTNKIKLVRRVDPVI